METISAMTTRFHLNGIHKKVCSVFMVLVYFRRNVTMVKLYDGQCNWKWFALNGHGYNNNDDNNNSHKNNLTVWHRLHPPTQTWLIHFCASICIKYEAKGKKFSTSNKCSAHKLHRWMGSFVLEQSFCGLDSIAFSLSLFLSRAPFIRKGYKLLWAVEKQGKWQAFSEYPAFTLFVVRFLYTMLWMRIMFLCHRCT